MRPTMDLNDPQNLADVMDDLDAVNVSEISLPPVSGRPNYTDDRRRGAPTWWENLFDWGEANPSKWVEWEADGSSLHGYHVTIGGQKATLIVLSYDQNGEEGCCLIDDHLTSKAEIVEAWMGCVSIEEYRDAWEHGNGHAILDYSEIPDDWERV